MWWYIAFSIVFCVYAFDLVFLFVASLFATVVEHFAPPLSTAANRAYKARTRKELAKRQLSSAASGKDGGKVAAGGVAGAKQQHPDLDIVVDTRGGLQVCCYLFAFVFFCASARTHTLCRAPFSHTPNEKTKKNKKRRPAS